MPPIQTPHLVRSTITAAIVATLAISYTPLLQAQQPRPSPMASMQGQPADGQAVVVGSHRLVVPRPFVVSRLENGTVQVQYANMTGHLAVRETTTAVAAAQLPGLMQAWNPAHPLAAIGGTTAEYAVPAATLASQRYQQNVYGVGLVHGLFLVYVPSGPRPEAIVLDVFANGPAQAAQDWTTLTEFAGAILTSVLPPAGAGTRPQPGPGRTPAPGGTPGQQGHIPDPVHTGDLRVDVVRRAMHDTAEDAASYWFRLFPGTQLPSHDAGMIYAHALNKLPADSTHREPIQNLLDRYNRMMESFNIR